MFDEQLIVAGTGIRTIGQMTMETLAWLRKADKVLHVVNDPVADYIVANYKSCQMLHSPEWAFEFMVAKQSACP